MTTKYEYFSMDSKDAILELQKNNSWSLWWKTETGFYIADFIPGNTHWFKATHSYKDDIVGGWQRAREMVHKEGWFAISKEPIPQYKPEDLVSEPDKPETYKDMAVTIYYENEDPHEPDTMSGTLLDLSPQGITIKPFTLVGEDFYLHWEDVLLVDNYEQ